MNAAIRAPEAPALWIPDFTPEHYVFLDFESFFEKGYSLSGSTTAAYVRDPRWEMLCVGVKIDDEPAVVKEPVLASLALEPIAARTEVPDQIGLPRRSYIIVGVLAHTFLLSSPAGAPKALELRSVARWRSSNTAVAV